MDFLYFLALVYYTLKKISVAGATKKRKEVIFMNEITILKRNKLFANIKEADIPAMLKCLGTRRQSFQKGEYICMAGRTEPAVGILLSSEAQITKENRLGDAMIVGTIRTGDLFGEVYACMGKSVLPVSVVALGKCDVLLLHVERIIHTCQSACPFHQQLITNLLRIIAEKTAMLSRKMEFIAYKTIRSRLEAYFYDRMEQCGSNEFIIPLNRNELADYLCVDRSAMCRELSHMKADGLLDYKGNHFYWLKKDG